MIWCLHGFLGAGADWDHVRAATAAASLPPCVTPDFFARPHAETSLATWAEAFTDNIVGQDPDAILLGYSLGGRLALHALVSRPERWLGAIIVSAHLGLAHESERAARREADEQWARRFESDPWDRVLHDWNRQAVFAGQDQNLLRPESHYDRSALAAALRHWSLGTQEPLAPRLRSVKCPVLWIAGERDTRYVEQGREAQRHLATCELRVAPDTGHRVPWEAATWFTSEVVAFAHSLLTDTEQTKK